MLTDAQEKYLLTIPDSKTVTIQPFSAELAATADELVVDLHKVVPDLPVRHMGASALGISGQGDIDIYVLCDQKNFARYLPAVTGLLGEPTKQSDTSITWAFEQNGFPVEVYLTDPTSPAMQEQISIFEILQAAPDLRTEYEQLKESLNGQSFRDYQQAKYEFYNRVLALR